jgi:hypothetical protein
MFYKIENVNLCIIPNQLFIEKYLFFLFKIPKNTEGVNSIYHP